MNALYLNCMYNMKSEFVCFFSPYYEMHTYMLCMNHLRPLCFHFYFSLFNFFFRAEGVKTLICLNV